jgi:tetratricopeptide (TPR) repeat protein
MKRNNSMRRDDGNHGSVWSRLRWQPLLVLMVFAGNCLGVFGQDTNRASSAANPAPPTNAEDTLRSYLQLQEQVHAAQLAIERTRQDSDAAAAHNAEVMEARLQAIAQSLNSQREQELDAMRSSNRSMLLVAVLFSATGVLAMLLTAFFHWRTVHRLAEITASLPPGHLIGPPPAMSALGPSEAHLMMEGSAAQASGRLLEAVNRIEQRLHELEYTAQGHSHSGSSATALSDAGPAPANGQPAIAKSADASVSAEAERISVLLGKGQSLLNLDQPQEALVCFDAVLQLDSRHTDALVKKGAALERLRKLDEALECYDQAIAADGSLTIAYLYKGGLFNRQERFSDALRCYEQALHTKEANHG